MVKKIVVIGLMLIVFSCIPTKNEYDLVRFKPNRFSIKPNKNKDFTKVIDTSGFYVAVLSKEVTEKYNLENYPNGMKFYNDGRVGHFKGIDFNNAVSFHPKKAIMGYYNYDGENFYIEKIFAGPSLIGSSYKLSLSKIIMEKSSKDTLFLGNVKSEGGRGYTVKYVKKKLPENFLIFKPDW